MTSHNYIWFIAGLLWVQLAGAQSGGCEAWGEARRIGELARIIDEASGVEASRRYPGRFYHVDDSSTTIHITDSAGGNAQVVRVSGIRGVDVEDLALGPCPEGSCLIIADIALPHLKMLPKSSSLPHQKCYRKIGQLERVFPSSRLWESGKPEGFSTVAKRPSFPQPLSPAAFADG